jgi:hypothetical protein
MLQKPNTVFVANKVNTAATSLVAGDIVLINAETGAAISTANIGTAKTIQLGYVKGANNIVKSQTISKKAIASMNFSAYVAKSEAVATFNLTGVTFVNGYRYVIRMIYKDLYEHPGQYTHSYEVIYNGTDSIDQVGAKYAARINKHDGARVTAAYNTSTKVLTLTAKVVNGPEAGIATKEAITPYSQVSMTGVMYYSNPTSVTGASHVQVPGVVITITDSKPGKGNPFIVRDREQAALAYKGITYRTNWPVVKPELNVDLAATYDSLVVEFSKSYQSPDNQYIKSTDLASEVYVKAGQGLAALNTAIAAWAV